MTVSDEEFRQLRNQVEMLLGFLEGKKIITAEQIAFIINESKRTYDEIDRINKEDMR